MLFFGFLLLWNFLFYYVTTHHHLQSLHFPFYPNFYTTLLITFYPDPPSRLRPQQGGGQAAVCSGVAQAGRRRQAKRRARTGGLLWELLFLPFRPLGLPRAPGFAFRILLSCFQEACRAPEKQAAAGVTGRAWAGARVSGSSHCGRPSRPLGPQCSTWGRCT